MKEKITHYSLTLVLLCCALCMSITGRCQNEFEISLRKQIEALSGTSAQSTVTKNISRGLFPNDAPQAIMSPVGWGGYGTSLFGSVGGAYPEVYTASKVDLIASAGMCFGNPIKAVNVAASINLTDVHRFRDFSGNISISRMIFKGTSVSVGGFQLFANAKQSDAPGPTFYVAISHAVQTLPSETEGCSKLSYTIGIGSGRFVLKSPKDIAEGKGKYGTAVFGSISYEVFQHVNLSAEWSGMNLGLSVGMHPFKNLFSFGVGVTNLTRNTSDKPNMVFVIGYPLSLTK